MVGGHVEVSMCLVACFSDTPFKKLCSLRCENFLSRCWQFLHISRCCRENLANLCGNTWISIPVGQKNMGGVCSWQSGFGVGVLCFLDWIRFALGGLWIGWGLLWGCLWLALVLFWFALGWLGCALCWLWFGVILLWVGVGLIWVGFGLAWVCFGPSPNTLQKTKPKTPKTSPNTAKHITKNTIHNSTAHHPKHYKNMQTQKKCKKIRETW